MATMMPNSAFMTDACERHGRAFFRAAIRERQMAQWTQGSR